MCKIAWTLCIRDITYYPGYRIILYFLQWMFTYFLSDCVIKLKNSNYCDSGAVSLFLSLASISELDSSMHDSGSSRKPLISWFLALSASRWIVTRLASLAMHINTLLHWFHFIPTTCRKSLSVAFKWSTFCNKNRHMQSCSLHFFLYGVFSLCPEFLEVWRPPATSMSSFFVHLSSAWKTSQWIESRCVSWSKRQMVEVKSKSLSCAWESWMDMGGAWWGNISRNAQLSDVWFDTWRHKQALQNLFM